MSEPNILVPLSLERKSQGCIALNYKGKELWPIALSNVSLMQLPIALWSMEIVSEHLWSTTKAKLF